MLLGWRIALCVRVLLVRLLVDANLGETAAAIVKNQRRGTF